MSAKFQPLNVENGGGHCCDKLAETCRDGACDCVRSISCKLTCCLAVTLSVVIAFAVYVAYEHWK